MDFVWNRVLANEVRMATERAMEEQSGNMHHAAKQLLERATNLERTTIPPLEERLENASSLSSRMDAKEALDRAWDRINALRAAARNLSEEAHELDRKKREANRMFEEMFRMAQETDSRYAAQMQALQGDINRYMARIQELRDSMGIVASCGDTSVGAIFTNQTNFPIIWLEIQRVLSQPADEITPMQYFLLADKFARMGESAAFTQRFLNYLADPVEIDAMAVKDHSFAQHFLDPAAFTVCPQKVAGLQLFLEIENGLILETQFGLIYQGMGADNPVIRDLTSQRRLLMERSALLSVVGQIATTTTESGGHDGEHPIQRVLVGSEANGGPFSIRQTTILVGDAREPQRDKTILSVHHGVLSKEGQAPHVVATLNQITGATLRGNSEVSISRVTSGSGASVGGITRTGQYYQQKHQFDMGSFIMSQAVSLARSTIVGSTVSVLKDAGSAAATMASEMMKHFDKSEEVFSKFQSERSKAESFQRDIQSVVDSGVFGAFHQSMKLDVVFIDEMRTPGMPHQTMVWPGLDSYAALRGLNGAARRNISWEEFMQNPEGQALDVFKDGIPNSGSDENWALFLPNDLSQRTLNNIRNNLFPQPQEPLEAVSETPPPQPAPLPSPPPPPPLPPPARPPEPLSNQPQIQDKPIHGPVH